MLIYSSNFCQQAKTDTSPSSAWERKVTEFSFLKVMENKRAKQWERPPCTLSPAQKSTPALQESRNSLGILGGVLGGRVQAAARGHALQLAGNGTDVGVSHHLGKGDARKHRLQNQLPTFFPKQVLKPSPTLLNLLLIPRFQVRAATFLGVQCKLCSEAFSCPYNTITRALSKGEESFWKIQRKRLLLQGNRVNTRGPGWVLNETTITFKRTPRSKRL